MDKVEKFISDMKAVFPEELEFTFYRGYCYWFALILAERFKGDIWFNSKIVHFATKIDGQLYDIFGKIQPGVCSLNGEDDYSEDYWWSWADYQIANHDVVESIVNSCIKKI